jgi:CheY-like chemotaxis protein
VPAAAPVQAPDANPRTGRILLVDDEDEVREPAAHYLRGQGYVVVEAHDGLDALDRFQPGAFDLVVMDLTMPRMNGRQAFAELRTRDAEVPVILCSGYDRENFTGGFTKAAPEGFLQKPYSFAVLGGKVAEVLMTRVGPRT